MASWKSLCIAALLSLGSGVFVWLLGSAVLPASSGAGYAVLYLEDSYPDRFIGEILRGMGREGFISESTQWVFLDDFGELLRLPLDSYGERLEPFDPRNDGYADRLRSFFVREGKRRFFIPLSGQSPESRWEFEENLGAALGDIPFTTEFLGPPGLFRGQLVLFVLAAAGSLAFSGSMAVFLLPLLAALSLAGPSGFALSAVLTALFHTLKSPLREWFGARRYGRRFPGSVNAGGRGPRKNRLPSVLAVLGLFLVYGLISLWGLSPLLGLSALAAFLLCLGAAFWAESNRGAEAGHVRFLPVPIRDTPYRLLLSSWAVLPFGLAALLSLLLPRFLGALPAPQAAEYPGEHRLMREDFENHLAFQSSFSLRPLPSAGEGAAEGGYFRYHLDQEGLITEGEGDSGFRYPETREIPPFPLEKLLDFLETYQKTYAFNYTNREIVSALLGFALGLPALLRAGRKRRKGGDFFMYNDKRIAA
jgi:hypothetical protein